MTTNLKVSRQTHGYAQRQSKSDDSSASLTGTKLYTCEVHAEIAHGSPGRCPECGAQLIPIRQAITRAAIALRSLYALTKALRLTQV